MSALDDHRALLAQFPAMPTPELAEAFQRHLALLEQHEAITEQLEESLSRLTEALSAYATQLIEGEV